MKKLILSIALITLNIVYANPFNSTDINNATSALIETSTQENWEFDWAGVVSYGHSDINVLIKTPRFIKWMGQSCLYPIKLRKTDTNLYYAQYGEYLFSYEFEKNKILFNIKHKNEEINVTRTNIIKIEKLDLNGYYSSIILNNVLNLNTVDRCI